MLEKVKLALRINHNTLDSDILATIEVARADAIRSGVPSEVMNNEEEPLVASLIKTYCLYMYSEKEDSEKYYQSYLFQLDNLRKSLTYLEGVIAGE